VQSSSWIELKFSGETHNDYSEKHSCKFLVAKNSVLKKLWCFTEQLFNPAEKDQV